MMGEGSGVGADLVLYLSLSFFTSIHRSKDLFMLCNFCSLCLGLCPLGFDFYVLFGLISLSFLDFDFSMFF